MEDWRQSKFWYWQNSAHSVSSKLCCSSHILHVITHNPCGFLSKNPMLLPAPCCCSTCFEKLMQDWNCVKGNSGWWCDGIAEDMNKYSHKAAKQILWWNLTLWKFDADKSPASNMDSVKPPSYSYASPPYSSASCLIAPVSRVHWP